MRVKINIAQCASFNYLKGKFPEVYLAELIFSSNEKSIVCGFYVNDMHKYSCQFSLEQAILYKRVSFPRSHIERNTETNSIYMNQIQLSLLNTQNEYTILNEMEHVNSAWVFRMPEMNLIMDKLLFSSNILNKFVVQRPAFGELLLAAFGDYLSNRIRSFNVKCSRFEPATLAINVASTDHLGNPVP